MGTKRFSRYKFALKTLLVNPENGARSQPPDNTALANYLEFASGTKAITYTRDEDSKPGEIIKVAINPFGLPLAEENKVKVPMSNRAKTATAVSGVITAANQATAEGVLLELNGFIPAKAIVSTPSGETAPTTKPKSQITGVPYTPSLTNSYTIPYGSKTGATAESQVRADILTAVDAIADATVSFNSEEL